MSFLCLYVLVEHKGCEGTMRTRINLPKQPQFDARFQGWSARFIRKNMWRSDPIYSFDDHMADAYILFRHVLSSYPQITEPKHIMALFQTSMRNEYNDKAKEWKIKRAAEISYETAISEDIKILDTLGEENNYGYLNILLSQLSPKLKIVIEALKSRDKATYLKSLTTLSSVKLDELVSGKELTDKALARILGMPRGTILMDEIKSALLNEDEMKKDRIEMSEISVVEKELLRVTGFKPEKKYRKRQPYLAALLQAVDGIDDDAYNNLTDEAIEWIEEAAPAFKNGTEIPDFDFKNHSKPSEVDEISEVTDSQEENNDDREFVDLTDKDYEGDWSFFEAEPNGSASNGKAELDESKEIKQKVKKSKTTTKEHSDKINKAPRGKNKWGVALGTKGAIVCELIHRPEGATMKEIEEVTGATRYNLINKLKRYGHNVVVENKVIKLLD